MKINCECGQSVEVDSSAGGQTFNCPSCNKPKTVPELVFNSPTNENVVTIQQTCKRHKARLLMGWVLIGAGFFSMTFVSASLGLLIVLIGIGVYLWGRIGAWWSNG